MSLATRCTSCDTVFRVVQDQLKVSEGWVRCGRCSEVFNALEGLFDLEPELRPPTAPPAPVDRRSEPRPRPSSCAATTPLAGAPSDVDRRTRRAQRSTSRGCGPGAAEFDATPASRVAARDRVDFADARFNSALLAEAGVAALPPTDRRDEAAAAGGGTDVATPTPEFLRQAERKARRERPRAVLALCAAVPRARAGPARFRPQCTSAICWRQRCRQARPALQALCDVAGCRIEPLRRIDDIVIESSALTSAPSGDAVRLSVVLRNRGPLPLAMPSIELTLTDAGGQMLARRALSPADFGVGTRDAAGGAETALQLVLPTSGRRASGYTVEPFYP